MADEKRKAWSYEICGQVVEWQATGKPRHPVEVYETCKLKGHYVGDECIHIEICRRRENWCARSKS